MEREPQFDSEALQTLQDLTVSLQRAQLQLAEETHGEKARGIADYIAHLEEEIILLTGCAPVDLGFELIGEIDIPKLRAKFGMSYKRSKC